MRKFFKLITNRITIVLFLILLQFVAFYVLTYVLSEYETIRPWVEVTIGILSAVIALHVVGGTANSGYKLSWIVFILVLPVFGCLYYIFYHQWNIRKSKRKRVEQLKETRKVLLPISEDFHSERRLDNYLSLTNWPLYRQTKTTFYPSGELAMKAILKKMREAKKYILIEFFVFKNGKLFDEFFSVLKEKAKEGIEVKLIYDDFGSPDLKYSFAKKMKDFGIEVRSFNPVTANINMSFNYRDHRKIIVIDGEFAFTGGINIGDEYVNLDSKLGHWLDCGIFLEGDAVWSLVVTFFENWLFKKQVEFDFLKYKSNYQVRSSESILPFAEIPFDNEDTTRNVLLDLITNSKKKIHISTPYLILDNELVTALSLAAKSGVDVKIIIPKIPDKKLTYVVTKSYAYDLMMAGVKVYKYTPGFNHAKVFIFDSIVMMGTSNLDFRSMYLHLENNVLIYDCKSLGEINEFFDEMINKSEIIDEKDAKRKNIFYQIGRAVLRVFAPQL